MANSSERKQSLIGWSYKNSGFFSNTQLQKFLFFYECLSKIDGDVYELEGLKGYKNGPVFSGVFGDIKYDSNFRAACGEKFLKQANTVNERRAKLSDFLVKILGNGLSEFTHKLDIWASKKAEIENDGFQIPLDESDFSGQDETVFRNLEHAYPESYINSVNTKNINGKTFVIYKEDEKLMTDFEYEALNEAAYDSDFENPIYISFSETGELILD